MSQTFGILGATIIGTIMVARSGAALLEHRILYPHKLDKSIKSP
jgi:hypothetical protein